MQSLGVVSEATVAQQNESFSTEAHLMCETCFARVSLNVSARVVSIVAICGSLGAA